MLIIIWYGIIIDTIVFYTKQTNEIIIWNIASVNIDYDDIGGMGW